ncbi:FdtA/QdtA family cupin domain-containing protein [Cytophagaceae bacterium ABcell3]|nr:FdtA/QdtA family cupin domain-containing protein [Cytophagaceae bacterium ABcell3]
MTKPRLIDIPKIGSDDTGFISVAQIGEQVPFEIQRVFWIYDATGQRGNHAHRRGEQVIVALKGEVRIALSTPDRNTSHFVLANADQGLLLPEMHWIEFHMAKDAILLCISSVLYAEDNYIRTPEHFFL